MARPRKVPWVAVRIDLLHSAKLTDLPNDTAMLGYVSMLLEAKTQRRMGVFESERHWRLVMGRFARYLPAYVAARLVERYGSLCEKCLADHPDLSGSELVVHDYLREQRDPTHATRQEHYRKETSSVRESDAISDAVSDGNETPISRALSLSLSREDQETGERGRGSGGNPRPAADLTERDRIQAAMYDASGLYFPVPSRNGDRLEVMAKRVGVDRLIETIGQAAEDMGGYADQAALVNTVANYLSTPLSGKRETSAQRDDREMRERAAAINAAAPPSKWSQR
jgi:hypothetical protein